MTTMYRFLLLILILCYSNRINAQENFTQNIKGQITDQTTGSPLIGANVFILDSEPLNGTSTDEKGYFIFKNLPIGRYQLGCSYVGFKSALTSNMLLTSGKELVVNIVLEEELNTIEVEISAITDSNLSSSGLTATSVTKFDAQLASRYAGSRSDVSRMAAGFAGVSANDDSRNDIIIRGNSPSGLLWRLNGVDIPNPSHFGALGSTGGPVSMLNNNLLENSSFITGAFPAVYGNALSGVFDLTMRKGNKDKFEGLGAISFNGFEAGIEGPIGKNGGSYIANYRYSVLDLVDKLFGGSGGATGTGDAIPAYQDLSFNVFLPTEKLGSFSIFGLGGNSDIAFLTDIAESDSPNLYSDSNENLFYKTNMKVIGIVNKHYYNNNSFGKLNLSYSSSGVNTEVDTVGNNLIAVPVYRDDSSQERIRMAYDYKNKLNKKNTLLVGGVVNRLQFNFIDSVRMNQNQFRSLRSFTGDANLFQGYLQWQHKFNDKTTLNLGGYGQRFTFNNTGSLEPRLSFSYKFSPKLSFNVGAGRHSKLQDYQLYLVRTRLPDGSYVETNNSLGLTKSDQFVTGINWDLNQTWQVKTEVYYQSLSDIPVETIPSNFSAINLGADFNIPSRDSLVNNGSGTNYGLEISANRSYKNGFYTLATLSIFKSTYKGSNGIEHSTAFDNNYVGNILLGKELRLGKKYSLGFDTKVTFAGGRKYTPIDLEASIIEGEAVLVKDSSFDNQFDDYFRADLKITLRKDSKRISESWSIDLQNVTNRENVFGETFDVRNKEIDLSNQLGFFPVIEYKLTF